MKLTDIYHVIETSNSKDLNRYLKNGWELIATATHGDMDQFGIKSEITIYSVGCNKDQYEFYKNNPEKFQDPNISNLPY